MYKRVGLQLLEVVDFHSSVGPHDQGGPGNFRGVRRSPLPLQSNLDASTMGRSAGPARAAGMVQKVQPGARAGERERWRTGVVVSSARSGFTPRSI